MSAHDISPAQAWQAAMDRQAWSQALELARAWHAQHANEPQSLLACQAQLMPLLLLHRTDEFSALLLAARFAHGAHPLFAAAEACLLALLERDADSHAALAGLPHEQVLVFASALFGPAMALLNPHAWQPERVRAFIVYEQQQACVWPARARLGRTLELLAEQTDLRWEQARFISMTFGDSEDVQHRIAERMADAWPAAVTTPVPRRAAKPSGKLRLAYLVPRFSEHASIVLMGKLPLFQNRQQFDIRAYSYGTPPNESTSEQVLQGCAPLLHLPKDTQAAALQIASDDIDMLIILPDIEMDAVAPVIRACGVPVIVNYLSFICSTGGLAHYSITDAATVAASTPAREASIAWPGSAYVYSDHRRELVTRAQQDLPEDALVLAAFNAAYKLSPGLCEVWARLLASFPSAVLWLHRTHVEQVVQMHAWFAARGVEPARVIFAEGAPHAEHLGRLALADLFLDAWDRGGHTSVLDALSAGVPVVARDSPFGRARTVQRVAPLLLRELGAQQFVGRDEMEYEVIAAGLCASASARADYRALILGHSLHSSLHNSSSFAPFDLALQAQRLDASLLAAYERFRQGLDPAPIKIIDIK